MNKIVFFVEDNFSDFQLFSNIMKEQGYDVYPKNMNNQDDLTIFLCNQIASYEQLRDNIFNYIIKEKLYDKLSILLLDINLFKEIDGKFDEYGIDLLRDFRTLFYSFYKEKIGERQKLVKWSKSIPVIALTNYDENKCKEFEKGSGNLISALNKSNVIGDKKYFIAKLDNAIEIKLNIEIYEDKKINNPIEFNVIDLNCADNIAEIRTILAQPDLSLTKNKKITNVLSGIEETEEYKKYISAILKKAEDDNSNLVVFPELSIPQSLYPIFEEWTKKNKNVLVIAGSDYIENENKYYNIASIFCNGEKYKTEKLIPSPLESNEALINDSLSSRQGYQNIFINTPIGKLGLIICHEISNDELLNYLKTLKLDVLVTIAYQNKHDKHWNRINTSFLEGENHKPFCIYCNSFVESNADGGSAIFAEDFSKNKKDSENAELVKNDSLSFKQLEMPIDKGGGALVAFYDLKKIVKPDIWDKDRSPFSRKERYSYEKDCLKLIPVKKNG